MAAGRTYTPIATTTLTSATNTITFSSIPTTYTDLILIASMIASGATTDGRINFNSDTGANYSATRLMGDGTSATSNRSTNRSWIDLNYVGGLATYAGNISILHINNYSNTTTYKTTLLRANELGSTYQGTEAIVGLWRNTAAITRFDITNAGGNYAPGTTFTLYGIQAA